MCIQGQFPSTCIQIKLLIVVFLQVASAIQKKEESSLFKRFLSKVHEIAFGKSNVCSCVSLQQLLCGVLCLLSTLRVAWECNFLATMAFYVKCTSSIVFSESVLRLSRVWCDTMYFGLMRYKI